MKIIIPKDANDIIHMLQNNGYEAYIVGGCVRDSLLGRTPHDWDICTSATPEEMLNLFKGKRIIETGLQHGTVTIVLNGEGYEVTTYRIDGKYTDGRRPDNVTFSKSLEQDLLRRDFTINAMAYNDEEGLVDLFGGQKDLKNHNIRCVGSTVERFDEDSLRILRAIRFACQLGFDIDFDIRLFMEHEDLKEMLKPVSVERIYSEFCKMVITKDFHRMVCEFPEVFGAFIPEIWKLAGLEQNNPYHIHDVFMHTVYALKHCQSDDLYTKLAVLFHDFGKPDTYELGEDGYGHFRGHGSVSAEYVDKIFRRLNTDNEAREKVKELVLYHDSTFETSEKCVKRWLNRIGEEQFKRLLDIRYADVAAQNPKFLEERVNKLNEMHRLLDVVLEKEACFSLKDLAIDGHDLISIGFKPGKELGAFLNMLLEGVIDDTLQNEREELLGVAKVFLKDAE